MSLHVELKLDLPGKEPLMRSIFPISCALLLACAMALAGPTTKPASPATHAPDKDAAAAPGEDFLVSKMRVQELKPQTLLYAEIETTLSQIGQAVPPVIEKLRDAIKEGNV